MAQLLERQKSDFANYPLTDKDKRHLSRRTKVRTLAGEVEVEVPGDEKDDAAVDSATMDTVPATAGLSSIQMQAKVAQIGIEMGFRVWVPRNDKVRVQSHVPAAIHDKFLDILPLNYDETALRTIEQIDVLWLTARGKTPNFSD